MFSPPSPGNSKHLPLPLLQFCGNRLFALPRRSPSDNGPSAPLPTHSIGIITSSSSSSSSSSHHHLHPLHLIIFSSLFISTALLISSVRTPPSRPPFAEHLLDIQISIHLLIQPETSSSSSVLLPLDFPVGLPFLQLRLHFHPELLAIVVANAPQFLPRFRLLPIHSDDPSSLPSSSSSSSSSSSPSSSSSSSSSSDASRFFHLCPLNGLLSLQTQLVPSNYAVEVIVEEPWTGAKGKKRFELRVGDNEVEDDPRQAGTGRQSELNFFNFRYSETNSASALTLWVEENAANGTILCQFGQRFGPQTELVGAEGMPFGLAGQNGTLAVIGPIDAENVSLFSFHLRNASDKQHLFRVDVLVRDENEHAPAGDEQKLLSTPIVIAEDAPIGARIVHIDMRDADRTSELLAFVDPFWTDEHSAFEVDEEGWLRLAARLDRERQADHRVHIRLMDGQPPMNVLFSSLVLNISVSDANDCAPQFPSPSLDFFVDENSPAGTVFGTLLATDRDSGENGTVNDAIDRELLTKMDFIVEAFDLGTPQHRSAVKVRVRVVDQDDNRPELEQKHLELELREGAPAGELLARLSYKDADEGTNALALFSIVKVTNSLIESAPGQGQDLNDQFHVGIASGVLSLARPLDDSVRANDAIRLNISLSAFTARWPPSFISVSLKIVPPITSPPHSRIVQSVRLVLHPLITLPLVFHRIVPPHSQPNCTFVLLNQSLLFSVQLHSGLVRLLRLPDARQDEHALSVLISSAARSSSSTILKLVVQTTFPISSSPFLLTPPVQFVHAMENAAVEVKVRVDQLDGDEPEEQQKGRIRFKVMEERCDDRWEEGGGGERTEDAGGAEAVCEGSARKGGSGEEHFSIDPFSGLLRSRVALVARRCSLWRVRIGAFDVLDEWNSNGGAEESTALVRVRVLRHFAGPDDSLASPPAYTSSTLSDCVFLSTANSPSTRSPFTTVRIDENEVPSDKPLVRVGLLQEVEGEASASISSASPIEFEMEGSSQEMFRLDVRKGTVRMARAMDRERDGGRHRVTIWARAGLKRTKMPCILESLKRSSPVGSVVFKVQSEDPDLAQNARNWFSLDGAGGGEEKTPFAIDKWTGEMKLISELGRKSAFRLGVTVQDAKWRVHSIMTVQIVEDDSERGASAALDSASDFVDFVLWGEDGGEEKPDDAEKVAEGEEVVELGRVKGRCCSTGAGPAIGWAWTKHVGTETALIADRRLFRLLENGDGMAKRELPLFCVDGNDRRTVRLHWNGSSDTFESTTVSPSDQSDQPTPIHLIIQPSSASYNLSSKTLPPSSIASLLVHNLSTTVEVGRAETNWHFQLEESDQSWTRVDERSGIITVNGSEISRCDDGRWKDGEKKLIGVRVTDKRRGRAGVISFRLFSPPCPSHSSSPKFARRFWHFSVPRHSPAGTIVGQLRIRPQLNVISSSNSTNNAFQIVLDAKEENGQKEESEEDERKKVKEERPMAANVVVAMVGRDTAFDNRCTIRVFFSDRLPPCLVFPSARYSVRLSSAAPDQTVLLRFDIVLPTGFRIVLDKNAGGDIWAPFCFLPRSPSVLSLCSPVPPLLPSSTVSRLSLNLVHPSGRICSRSSVSVHILSSPPEPNRSAVLPGGVGFVRRNALPGQNVLQFRNGCSGPFEISDERMDELFRLHPSSGVLSTRTSLRKERSSLFPIPVRSPNRTFLLFVVLEDERVNADNANNASSDGIIKVSLPVISSVSSANGKPQELPLLAAEYSLGRRRCVPASQRLGSELASTATVSANCSLLLPPLASSVPPGIVALGSDLSLHIHSLDVVQIFPFLVELRMYSSTTALGTILEAIERAVPDLGLLVPFVLSDTSLPFGLRRLLIALRDPNGNILPQTEAIRVLHHFAITFPEMVANVWDYRVEESAFRVEAAEDGILNCLGGRTTVGTTQRVWAPFKLDENCLRFASLSGSRKPSGSEVELREQVGPAMLSFLPSKSGDNFGFVRLSGVLFPRVRRVSLQFLTTQSSALLLYLSADVSASQFISVDLINGKARLNVPLQSRVLDKSVNDGKWWHLELSWTERRLSLALAECRTEDDQSGDECPQAEESTHQNLRAQLLLEDNSLLQYVFVVGAATVPHPHKSVPPLLLCPTVILGDISAFPDLLRLPGRTSAFSFIGCQRRIAIDGFDLNEDLHILEEQFDQFRAEINGTSSDCPLIESVRKEWAKQPIVRKVSSPSPSVTVPSALSSLPAHSAACLLFHWPATASTAFPAPCPPFSGRTTTVRAVDGHNALELDFHSPPDAGISKSGEEALLCIEFEHSMLLISLEQANDVTALNFFLLRRHNKTGARRPSNPFTFRLTTNSSMPSLNNVFWHRMAMDMSPDAKTLRLQLDDVESVHQATFPNLFPLLLSAELKSLSLGASCSPESTMPAFRGCVRRFLVNNQLQQIHPQMDAMPEHKRVLRLLIEGNPPEVLLELCVSSGMANGTNPVAAVAVLSFLLASLLLGIIAIVSRRRKRIRHGKESAKMAERSLASAARPPTISEEGGPNPKRAPSGGRRSGLAVSPDTFSSLGFSYSSTLSRHSDTIEPGVEQVGRKVPTMQLPTQVQHPNPAQQQPQRTTPHSPATTTAPSTPSQQLQQRAHVPYHQQQHSQHYPLQANPSQLQQHTRPQQQQSIRPSHHASGGVQQQHSSEQQLHSMGGPSPFHSQPPSVQSFQEQEMGGVAGPPRLAHGQPHVSHQQVVMGQRHSGHPPPQQQQQQQMLVGHHQTQQQHPTTMRIEQSGQVMHMHPAPPAPPHQPQRIYVQHSVAPLPPQSVQPPHEPPLHPPPPLPHLYIGSQRFATSIMAEMEVQPNVSPKHKYRDLKKKFKYLVYENEYYQEELRNLQRKLLKLSRDKNFLLDRLGQYEQLSESSDDSDASTKTLEERGVVKQKKKPKQAPNRKRAAPNSGGAPAGQPKRVCSKTTPAKSKDTSREGTVLRLLPQSQVKEELEQFGGENIGKQWDESLASPTMAQVQHQKQSDGREDSMESVDKVNETANCSFKLTNSLFSFKRISPSLSAKRRLTTDDGLDKASPPEKKQQIGLPVSTVVGDDGWESVHQKLEKEEQPIARHENPSPSPASTSSSSSWHPFLCSLVEPTWQTLLDKEFKMEYIRTICSFLEEQDKKGVAVFPPRHLIFNAFNLTPFDKIRVVLIGQDPYHNLRQAHGLCFSVPNGEPMPPSLKNIFKELSSEFSDFTLPKHGTLTKWALQGVFLLNASLNSRTVHPSPLSAHRFFGCKCFSQTNAALAEMGREPIEWTAL
ncbi:hypothetical protein GPALN_010992 [Globodera pallida]|nr:hypothetical protein GPALN_010992 [Globodera pallida]